jgi:hypothetical protein
MKRINHIQHINRQLSDTKLKQCTIDDLVSVKTSIVNDLSYIDKTLKEANKELADKISSGKNITDKEMFSLSWGVDGLSRLVTSGHQLYAEVACIIDLLQDDQTNVIKANISGRISKWQEGVKPFIPEVTRYQRKKATHILVTMISPSQRLRKPYALPVSCVPYHSLTANQARSFINTVIMDMTKRNMKVVGMWIEKLT